MGRYKGGGGETAIASNPEQKTGVSTVVAPDDRSGFQDLGSGWPPWLQPMVENARCLFSDKVGKACV